MSNETSLSASGEQRRSRMLAELQAVMVQRHQRRRRRGHGVAAAILIATASTIVWLLPGTPTPNRSVVVENGPVRPAGPRVIHIHTDPTILERIAFDSDGVSREVFVDDAGLLATLTAIDRPTGLIRLGTGEVRLTRQVVDKPQAADGAG